MKLYMVQDQPQPVSVTKHLQRPLLGPPGAAACRPNTAATQPSFWMPQGEEEQGLLHFGEQAWNYNYPVPPAPAFQAGLLGTQVSFLSILAFFSSPSVNIISNLWP